MSSPETIPPAVPDLRALVRAVAWEHYGRRTHLSRVEPGYRVVCGCGWESTSTAKRDEADAQHSDHLADGVRAALLSTHRDKVLDEVAQHLDAAALAHGHLHPRMCHYTEIATEVRRLAATGPADGPSASVEHGGDPAVPVEAEGA